MNTIKSSGLDCLVVIPGRMESRNIDNCYTSSNNRAVTMMIISPDHVEVYLTL